MKFMEDFNDNVVAISEELQHCGIEKITNALKAIPNDTDPTWLSRSMSSLEIIRQTYDDMEPDSDEKNIANRIEILQAEIVSDLELMLTLASLLHPKNPSKSIFPLDIWSGYSLIFPLFDYSEVKRRTRRQFLYELRSHYLTWFHLVSLIVVINLVTDCFYYNITDGFDNFRHEESTKKS